MGTKRSYYTVCDGLPGYCCQSCHGDEGYGYHLFVTCIDDEDIIVSYCCEYSEDEAVEEYRDKYE